METFLVRELGYSWDEVHDEAEMLEHAVSDLMLDRIDAKLGHPTRDPHGDPIPVRRRPGADAGRAPAVERAGTATPVSWPGFPTPIRRCCGTSTPSASAWIRDCWCWPGATSQA